MKKEKINKINNTIDFGIIKLNPAPMSCTHDNIPNIYADYTPYKNEINALSIRMFINDIPVPAIVDIGKIAYTPRVPLGYGKYNIKVSFIYNNEIYTREWEFNIIKPLNNEKYYFGITHCHTNYSTGRGTPKDAYMQGYNKHLNYMIITDHAKRLSRTTNILGNKNNKIQLSCWDATTYYASYIRAQYKRFTPMQGYELGIAGLGHVNVYNTNGVCDRRVKTVSNLLEYLRQEPGAIICINHPSKKILNLPYIEELDKYIQLIEVGNGTGDRYKRYTDIYFKMLDKGWHLGAVNGQDNHKSDWGEDDNLTGVIAQEGNGNHILEAMRERRVYSTEVRNAKLSFKINGYHMGSKINVEPTRKVEARIKFKSKSAPVIKVEVISNRGEVIESFNCREKKDGDFKIFLKKYEYEKWYVVRLIHIGNFETISSPIFI